MRHIKTVQSYIARKVRNIKLGNMYIYFIYTSELNVHANISKQCGIYIRVNLNTYFGNAANRAET